MRQGAIFLALLMLGGHRLVEAQPPIGVPPSQLYRLTDKSSLTFGCFEPCLCAIESASITGTFQLTVTSRDSSFTYYAVTDVNWLASINGTESRITGSGTFRIGGDPARTEEMQLELVGTFQPTFDSGIVPESVPGFPAINLSVWTEPGCVRTGIAIAAVPVEPSEILPFSILGSEYATGCFGSCLCGVRAQPLFGTFGLVELAESDGKMTFGVVGVRWEVPQSSSSGSTVPFEVGGFGLYETSSPPGQQRMLLDLTLDGAPSQTFDSGGVPDDENIPRIDIALAPNGFSGCVHQVFDLHAIQRHGHGRGQPIPPPM